MAMNRKITRREFIRCGARATAAAFVPVVLRSRLMAGDSRKRGLVIGESTGATVGARILAAGGNAIDAAVAAAFAASVASPHNCGPGGYGGHMVIALAKTGRVTAIDFNSAAPKAMRPDLFLDKHGRVNTDLLNYGWLSAGVPGTLAGLQLALNRYGTMELRDVMAPAVDLAKNGFAITPGMAAALRAAAAHLKSDPPSARIFFENDRLLQAGDRHRNPDLAQLLGTLAERNSVDSFYRGDLGQRIVDEFQRHGGILAARDLADYNAVELLPLKLEFNQSEIYTAPLTAGGFTVLEALLILRQLDWHRMPVGPEQSHARLEALRVAWADRLEFLGDPAHAAAPFDHFLSTEYADDRAAEIRSAIRKGRPLPLNIPTRNQHGTVHLSSVDAEGNMVALTMTHGGSFGSRITVNGLGLTLGHGMSRFEPRPGHPNSAGPGKRPLHNMCPSVVLRGGKPILALGAAGGRMIPNAVFDVLTHYVALDRTSKEALAAPRLHSEGNLNVTIEKSWPANESDYFRKIGYTVRTGSSAKVSLISAATAPDGFYSATR